MDDIRKDASVFEDPKSIKILRNVLKTNTAVCGAAGTIYGIQFGTVYVDLITLYESANQIVKSQIEEKGTLLGHLHCHHVNYLY